MLRTVQVLCSAALVAVLGFTAVESAGQANAPKPKIHPASDEAERAIRRFKVPEGFTVELFAAEPMLANPVAFTIDEHGRFYVSETFRLHAGVGDIRGRMSWLNEDLANRTTDDYEAMLRRRLGDQFAAQTHYSEQVRLLIDTSGDGRADVSKVFAGGFNSPVDGIAAGVLARKGTVWFANIPHLWLLRDETGDNHADVREPLHHGYGVRTGFIGHDLHGLRMGPDGKLYFSIGDRGFNVTTEGRTVAHPDTGAVLRCNPDGSELEIVSIGLRNPQELAFDEYGNLFTGDNDSDGGDRPRLVHVVEGGESGWHIGWQFINEPNPRGAWNTERMWHERNADQPAYMLPPVAVFGAGPSGFTFYPGTGLPETYNGNFLLCDFRGQAASSVIHAFAVRPNGAGFEMIDRRDFMGGILATDVEFGPDGAIYVSDWVEGWGMPGKGRIYRVFHEEAIKEPIVRETQRLIAEGMEERSSAELARLLEHRDQRVRQEAQFELAERGAVPVLRRVLNRNDDQLARIHAIWGLGQIAARHQREGRTVRRSAALTPVTNALTDDDSEIRAQAARVLGDNRFAPAYSELINLLGDDSNPRGQFFAAMALGKLRDPAAVNPVLDMLRANHGEDLYLRHAGVMALFWINDHDALLRAMQDEAAEIRMAALLALRRLERVELTALLLDQESQIVVEAARAINDLPIPGAMPHLAQLIRNPPFNSEPLLRRIVNANFHLGEPQHAAALAQFAARTELAEAPRVEALHLLRQWATPTGRDRITGLWQPLSERAPGQLPAAVADELPGLIRTGSDRIRMAAAEIAQDFKIKEAADPLLEVVRNGDLRPNVRVAALRALGAMEKHLAEAVRIAAADDREELRKQALEFQDRVQDSDSAERLLAALESGSIGEQQAALLRLGALDDERADQILADWLDKLLAGEVPPGVKLELLEAAAQREARMVKAKLSRFERARFNGAFSADAEVLAGGNAESGRRIFVERPETSCARCHRIGGEGGEAGPPLDGIGSQRSREHLLESILYPNRQITEGYETVLISLKNGDFHVGTVQSETEIELLLNCPDEGLIRIKKAEIERRDGGLSGMPEGLAEFLSKRDLRDLVEFLSSLK